MTLAVAVAHCVNKLEILENEVSVLKAKVKEDENWRRHIERWLKTQFDYDEIKCHVEPRQGISKIDDGKNYKVNLLSSEPRKSTISTTSSGKRKISSNPKSRRHDISDDSSKNYCNGEDGIVNTEEIPLKKSLKSEIEDFSQVNEEEATHVDEENLWKNKGLAEIKDKTTKTDNNGDYDLNEELVEFEILNSDEDSHEDLEFQKRNNGIIGNNEIRKRIKSEAGNNVPFTFSSNHNSSTSTFYEKSDNRRSSYKSLFVTQPNIKSVKDSGRINSLLGLNSLSLSKQVCPECFKTFKTPAEMNRHKRIHTNDKPYICYLCEYSTSFNGDLVRHLKSRHPGNFPYVCNKCDFKCQELLNFTDHRRHTGHGGRASNNKYLNNSLVLPPEFLT